MTRTATPTATSAAASANLGRSAEQDRLITPLGWAWIVAVGAGFVAFHWIVLRKIVIIAWGNSDWSHALLLPVIGVAYLAMHRDELAATRPRVSLWGLPLLLLGMLAYLVSIYPGQVTMFQAYSMIIALAGLTLLLLGPAMMRWAWFPIAYLSLGVPVSQAYWDRLAERLQDIAATGAAVLLDLIATTELPKPFAVDRLGNRIDLFFNRQGTPVFESLNVAEACAGLRSLMAFVALSVAIAFFNRRPWWHRLILVLSAVPIAVGINVVRVTVVGIIALYDMDAATGEFHTFVGLLMLIPAGLLFLALDWVLNRIVIREGDPAPTPEPAQVEPLAAASQPRRVLWGVAGGVLLAVALGLGLWLGLAGLDGQVVAAWLGGASLPVMLTLALLVILAAGAGAAWRLRTGFDVRHRVLALAVMGGFLLAAFGVQTWLIAQARLVMVKQPLELRETLATLGAARPVGTWKLLGTQPRLSEEIEKQLGTDRYVTATFQDLSWPRNEPGALVQVHVAYYSGGVDTVPHVPTRCFVAGGAIYRTERAVSLPLDPERFRPAPDGDEFLSLAATGHDDQPARLPRIDLPVTLFTFSPQEDPAQNFHVLYFFAANGSFYYSPYQVRWLGFDPRDRYGYYCKIEIRPLLVQDEQLARQRSTDLLNDLMPQIMARLPDWHALTHPAPPTPPAPPAPEPAITPVPRVGPAAATASP